MWYQEGTLAHMLAKRAEHITYAQVLIIAKFVMLVQSMMMPVIHARVHVIRSMEACIAPAIQLRTQLA